MGVDIQTYRARIGAYSHAKAGDVIKGATVVNFRTGLKTVGCLVFIGVLLIMAGIEPNPGPRGEDDESNQSDELVESVQDKEATVEEDLVPRIQISGVTENVNKEMLEVFFQNEERNGGGKIECIDIDHKNKCATITFEERAAVDVFMQRKPKSILGMDVSIKVIDTPEMSNTESTRIKISGLMENITKEILQVFFDKEERDGGGKVKSIHIDRKNRCAMIDFEDETGAQWIMKKTPMSILGMSVKIEIVGSGIQEPRMIKITKLPIDVNDEMIRMFFENKIDCDGKVVNVTIDSGEQYAIVEFADSAAVYKVMEKIPLTICGFKVDVDVFDESKDLDPTNVPLVKISGFTANINKEMLEMFFENEERNGGGKVKHIDIHSKNKCVTIEFEEKSAVDMFIKTKPKSILGIDVEIETIDTTSKKISAKSTKVKLSGLMENINKEMLELFFEMEKINGGGKVINIDIDNKTKCAVIEFEDETGVESIMKKAPMSIYGMKVQVEEIGRSAKESKRIIITKLPVTFNDEMIRMFFENDTDCSGRVVDVVVKSEEHCAIVEFDEFAAVHRVMDKRPLKLFGFEVDVDVFDVSKNVEPTINPRIKISGLMENINKEMLEIFFENEERNGGGKVKHIDIDKKINCATITFMNNTDAYSFMQRKPKTLLGMEVTVKIIDKTPQKSHATSAKIKISGLLENITRDMLEMFFVKEEREGGGKVKDIVVDTKTNCAIVEFEEITGAQRIMEKSPMTILGMNVQIEVIGCDAQEPRMIKITKVPTFMNRKMLLTFFEHEKGCYGNIVDVTVNTDEHYAIVTFDNSAAVNRVMDNRPFKIFDIEVGVDVFDHFIKETIVSQTKLRVRGLPPGVTPEILCLFFENENRQGGGQVKRVEMEPGGNAAVVEFEEAGAIDIVLKKKPISILGTLVDIQVFRLGQSEEKSTKIFVKDIPELVTEEILTLVFESERRQGGGRVKNINIDKSNNCGIVEFENEEAVQNVLKKQPISIQGKEVQIFMFDGQSSNTDITGKNEEHVQKLKPVQISGCDAREPRMIKITKVPTFMNQKMLLMFFEHEKGCYGNIVDVTVNTDEHYAIVTFDNSAAVNRVMDNRPFKIFDIEVGVDVFDHFIKETIVSQTKLRVKGLPPGATPEILCLFFENEKRQGGGQVKRVDMEPGGNAAVIEFEEADAIDIVLKKKPISILGTLVDIQVFSEYMLIYEDIKGLEQSEEKSTKIFVKGIPELVNEEILTMVFENERRQGGGKVKNINIDKSNNCGIVEFENEEAVQKVLEKQPVSIQGKEVQICVFDGEPLPSDIDGKNENYLQQLEPVQKSVNSQTDVLSKL